MLIDVTDVKYLGGHRLRMAFSDGRVGDVDLGRKLSFSGVYAELSDPNRFALVTLDAEAGTIRWPNGADIDAIMLWHWTTGQPLPEWARAEEDQSPRVH